MELQRGVRDKLDKYINLNCPIEAEMTISGGAVYDFCCFGVDANDKLSDDRYMIFYNQTSSPNGEINYRAAQNAAMFTIDLNRLPMSIQKLVFTVSIDGGGVMSGIGSHTFTIRQNGMPAVNLALSGRDFQQETAIITVEIYRKETWRINAVARGFNGGLGDLLRAYGGEEASGSSAPAPAPTPAPAPAPAKISLEKKIEKEAPALISLVKPLKVSLEKHNLTSENARVALVMDISGSMFTRYSNGTVQEIVNKVLPIAVQFDDDGELDFWYYGTSAKEMPSVNLHNYTGAVPNSWRDLMAELGYGNNEVNVMEMVCRKYQGTRLPAYVIFVTDGGVGNEGGIVKMMTESSRMPIFWQFVGVGGSNYGALERFDTMSGRYVDNANFFALDDFRSVSSEELYDRLLCEFPAWLREIRAKNMI